METENSNELGKHIAEDYKAELGDDVVDVMPRVIRELAGGEPVAPERIVERSTQPPEQVMELLDQMTLKDEDGRITAFGLSLTPTDHEFELDNRTMWVWCAVDALVFPAILNRTARIKSRCAVTGEPIEVVATPVSIEKVRPTAAAVSIITPSVEQPSMIRQLVCSGQLFFSSVERGRNWQRDHPEARIVPVTEAFALYQQVVKEVL